MLADKNDYLSAGIHIGMKACTAYMKRFVYKTREDGLCVFNLQEVDERIAKAISMLSKYNKVLVVSHKDASAEAIRKFAELAGGKAVSTRFSPGTLTNPSYREFYEPDIILVVDPLVDRQAIEEAKKKRIPIVSLCGTSSEAVDIDLVVPINNNSKKSLALFFWILAKGVMKSKGIIKEDSEFTATLKDFGDIGKEKRIGQPGLDLDSGLDVDIDIEIESGDSKKETPRKGRPKKATTGKKSSKQIKIESGGADAK